MKIQISKRAQREVERISKYWREHADHPTLFEAELLEKLEQLLVMPSLGVQYRTERKPGLMRSLLPKSGYHVYFSLETGSIVVIHAVWSARRGSEPKL